MTDLHVVTHVVQHACTPETADFCRQVATETAAKAVVDVTAGIFGVIAVAFYHLFGGGKR